MNFFKKKNRFFLKRIQNKHTLHLKFNNTLIEDKQTNEFIFEVSNGFIFLLKLLLIVYLPSLVVAKDYRDKDILNFN
jgi:hypothetical protein